MANARPHLYSISIFENVFFINVFSQELTIDEGAL